MQTFVAFLILTLVSAKVAPQESCEMSNGFLIGWQAVIQTEEFRKELLTTLVRDQIMSVYSDRLLASMEKGLKDKAKAKINSAVSDMREDMRRQLVEAATVSLNAKISEAKLSFNEHIRTEIKSIIAGSETIRGFLQQHEAEMGMKMQKVLSDSKGELEGLYREHLARIIQEDQYRTINAELIKDLDRKYTAQFAEVHAGYDTSFENSTRGWKVTIQKMLDDISSKTQQVTDTHTVVRNMETRIARIESNTNWALGLSLVAVGAVTIRFLIGFTQA